MSSDSLHPACNWSRCRHPHSNIGQSSRSFLKHWGKDWGIWRNRKFIRRPTVSTNMDTTRLSETESPSKEHVQDGLSPQPYMYYVSYLVFVCFPQQMEWEIFFMLWTVCQNCSPTLTSYLYLSNRHLPKHAETWSAMFDGYSSGFQAPWRDSRSYEWRAL